MDENHTDMTTRAVTANASLGDGSQFQELQKWRGAGSAAMRARSVASNAGEGVSTGRSSSALQRARNSSARTWHSAQEDKCSSTARRSAGLARPSRYSTNLSSIPVQRIWSSLPSANIFSGGLHASHKPFSVKVEPAPFITAGSK